MDVQVTNTAVEEIIRRLPKFGGSHYEDVIQWLHDTEEIYEQAQLRPSNKYIVAQYYLTATAEKWFRFNRSTIHDWFTFKIEIVKAFQSSTPSKISSTSVPLNNKQDEPNQLSLSNVTPLKSREVLEDKCPREYEQIDCSSMSVNTATPSVDIPTQSAVVADDYDQLTQLDSNVADDCHQAKPQDENVIESDPIQTIVDEGFASVTNMIMDLATDDISTTIVGLHDVSSPWFDKYQLHSSYVFPEIHTDSGLNQYRKKHYDMNYPSLNLFPASQFTSLDSALPKRRTSTSLTLTMYRDFAVKFVTQAWDYSYQHGFRYHSPNGICPVWFFFRKWKYRRSISLCFSFRKWKYRQLTASLAFSLLSFSFMTAFCYMFVPFSMLWFFVPSFV